MTKIAMRFVTTTDIPIGNALVAIRLTRSDYEEKTSGVLMPRLEEFHTDANGLLQVDLMPATALYHVTVYDTVQDIAIHHDFIVPEVEDPNTVLLLPDLIVPPDTVLSSLPYDEEALATIIQAKVESVAAAVRSENSATSSAASALAASTNAAQTAADRSAVAADRTHVTADAAQVATDKQAVSSNAAAALASKNAAATSAAEALVSKNAAATSATGASGSATAAANSATTAVTAKDTAVAAKDVAVSAKDQAVASQTAAAGSATAAATSATNSANSATASAASAAQSANKLPLVGGTLSGTLRVDNYIVSEGYLSILDINTVGVAPQWWKIGRLTTPNATSGKIVIGGTNGYTPVGGTASAGETTILLRMESDSKVRGSYYSSSAGAAAILGVIVDDNKDVFIYVGQGFRGAVTVFGQMPFTPGIAQAGGATPAGIPLYSKQSFMMGSSNPLTLLPTGASLVGNVTVDGGTLSVNGAAAIDVLYSRSVVNSGSVTQWWKLGRIVTVSTSTAATMTITSAAGYITGGGAASGTTGGETTIYFRAEDDTKIRGSFHSSTGGMPGVLAVVVDDNRDVYIKVGNYFTGSVLMQGQMGFSPGVVAVGAAQPAGYLFKSRFNVMLDGTTKALAVEPNYVETPKSLYVGSQVGSLTASGLFMPNEGALGDTGVNYTVNTLGVTGGVNAYSGHYAWQTRAGEAGVTAVGYTLALRAYSVGPSGGYTPELFSISGAGSTRIAGNLTAVGLTTIGLSGTQAQGTQKLTVANCANFFVSSGNFVNSSAANLTLSSNTVTGRSINAGGTINASGADYAEYMHKAYGCGVIVAGQVVGVNAQGQLTDKWVEATHFVIKSTKPCLVGGDGWADHLGQRPETVERIMPSTRLVLVSEAVEEIPPTIMEIDGEFVTVISGVPAKEAEYADEYVPGDTDEEWAAKQAPTLAFEERLQEARSKVDRIAFCGQVPVNVYNTVPGDYLVPVQDGEGISAQPISMDNMTMRQYLHAVGRVVSIQEDGRAYVMVKVV